MKFQDWAGKQIGYRAGRALDGALSVVAPTFAARRELAREQLWRFRFDAAWPTENRRGVWLDSQPDSPQAAAETRQLIREARDLCDNFPIAESVLLKFEDYAFGSVTYEPQTGSRDTDKRIKDFLAPWMFNCDVTGRHSLRRFAQLNCRQRLRDGDVLVAFVDGGDGATPNLRLRGINADFIGGSGAFSTSPSATAGFQNGVRLDAQGRIVAFEITNPTDVNSRVEIPASAARLVMRARDHRQYRGVTAFHAAVALLRDVQEIVDAERIGVKWSSYWGGAIETPQGGVDVRNIVLSPATASGGKQTPTEQLPGPGRVRYLSPGEKIVTFKSDRPAVSWQGFIQLMIRFFSLGFNLPYEFVFDMASLGGTGVRLVSGQADRTFSGEQQLHVETWLEESKNRKLLEGIASGKLPAAPSTLKGYWLFPGKVSIDAGRDAKAAIDLVAARLRDPADVAGEEGKDIEEIQRGLAAYEARWQQLADEFQVPVDVLRGSAAKLSPAAPAEEKKTEDEPPIPPRNGNGDAEWQRNGGLIAALRETRIL